MKTCQEKTKTRLITGSPMITLYASIAKRDPASGSVSSEYLPDSKPYFSGDQMVVPRPYRVYRGLKSLSTCAHSRGHSFMASRRESHIRAHAEDRAHPSRPLVFVYLLAGKQVVFWLLHAGTDQVEPVGDLPGLHTCSQAHIGTASALLTLCALGVILVHCQGGSPGRC